MQRTVPIVIGEQIQHEKLRLGEIILVLRYGKHDFVRNHVSIFLVKNSIFDDIFLIDRD